MTNALVILSMTKPYLRKIGSRGDIKIYEVDGDWIRSNQEIEFTNFACHEMFPSLVPYGEFWIDQGYQKEWSYFIDNLLVMHRLMEDGMSYDDAFEKADAKERRERNRGKTGRKTDTSSAIISVLKRLPDGREIDLVNGKMVRTLSGDPSFVEGAHWRVDKYIAPNHIYIEKDVIPSERPYIEVHEVFENNEMKHGMSYDKAHEHASELEWECRHSKEFLDRVMERLGLTNAG